MPILSLLLACAEAPADPWAGVPLQRGQKPAWGQDLQVSEAVSTLGNGKRRAHRVLYPRPAGDFEVTDATGRWTLRWAPDEGPARTWEITLFGDPERIAGVPVVLSPNGGEIVANPGTAEVTGVLDVNGSAYGVRCLGAEADLAPDGWCLGFYRRVWIERWIEP